MIVKICLCLWFCLYSWLYICSPTSVACHLFVCNIYMFICLYMYLLIVWFSFSFLFSCVTVFLCYSICLTVIVLFRFSVVVYYCCCVLLYLLLSMCFTVLSQPHLSPRCWESVGLATEKQTPDCWCHSQTFPHFNTQITSIKPVISTPNPNPKTLPCFGNSDAK